MGGTKGTRAGELGGLQKRGGGEGQARIWCRK